MSDPEVVDLTVEAEEDKKKEPQLDLAALAREREARRRSRGDDGDDGGDAKRPRVGEGAPVRRCIAAKLAPEAQREAPGQSLRDRLRGLVAGPFEGEGRALE